MSDVFKKAQIDIKFNQLQNINAYVYLSEKSKFDKEPMIFSKFVGENAKSAEVEVGETYSID
jgi:hypothetical protein